MGDKGIGQRINGDKVATLIPEKVLDNNNAHEMVKELLDLRANGFEYAIIDMAKMEFISSAGVGSILGTIEEFREPGGDIVLCNVPASIMHVFEVLDIQDFLTIKNTEKEAAAMCGISL